MNNATIENSTNNYLYFILKKRPGVNNFEYFAYDSTNNFVVIIKRFETLEAAQKYKMDHTAAHSNQTIRYVLVPSVPPPEQNPDL